MEPRGAPHLLSILLKSAACSPLMDTIVRQRKDLVNMKIIKKHHKNVLTSPAAMLRFIPSTASAEFFNNQVNR